MSQPSARVETQFGPLELVITSGSHVYVRNYGDEPFTVRGKEYRVSVGVTVPAYELTEGRSGINKRGDFSTYPVVAPTILAAIQVACTEAVRKYCTAHPDVLGRAEYEDARDDHARARSEVTALEEQLTAKRAEMDAHRVRMEAWAPREATAARADTPVTDDDRPCSCGQKHTIAEHNYDPDKECNECGAQAGASVSAKHEPSCSLHPANVVG